MVLGLVAGSRCPRVAPEPPPTPDRHSAVDVTAMSPIYPAANQSRLVITEELRIYIIEESQEVFCANKHLACT